MSQEAWLASLKANIGEFLFVPTDASAVTAMDTIGQTYPSAIDPQGKNVAPTQNTLSVILLMNDDATTPTKTMMIATQDDGSSGFEFVYAGNLQDAMPSNIVTTDKIDNAFIGGSGKVAGIVAGVTSCVAIIIVLVLLLSFIKRMMLNVDCNGDTPPIALA